MQSFFSPKESSHHICSEVACLLLGKEEIELHVFSRNFAYNFDSWGMTGQSATHQHK